MFQGSFQWGSSEFERSSKGNSGNFQFQGSFRGVPGTILAYFKKVSRVFQGRFQGVSMEFYMGFRCVKSSMGV